ncbi:MAG: type VI secretion system baseplate subunit TssK [Kiloniellales bacterium]|nr:type VI secretion system baseplate subunit TssK [Kiloniellales bacterium]
MTLTNKVVWSEGLFLRPQHFQQQDRYLESLVRRCSGALRPFGWGFKELQIDQDLLKTGKLAITRCAGIMPDGTYFNAPDEADTPLPLELSEDMENLQVHLVMPIQDPRGLDVGLNGASPAVTRFGVDEIEVRDNCGSSDAPAQLQVARLRLELKLDNEERSGFLPLGIARIIQVGADKVALFDDGFIPPGLDCRNDRRLAGFISEIEGLLNQRGESLAGLVSESGRGGAAEIADFLMLQTVNRYQPVVAHLRQTPDLHPEALYRLLLSLAGELSTFTSEGKRPPAFPEYRHDQLKETFEPLMASLRQSLSMVIDRRAIAIPLQERKYGIRVAVVPDPALLTDAMFVLAVNADLPAEALRTRFPAQVKIGPVEKIRDLVNRALPGVDVHALPVAPRQIPFHSGVTYFALDTKNAFWKEMDRSGGLAVHVGGKFPGLEMQFWAIRQ